MNEEELKELSKFRLFIESLKESASDEQLKDMSPTQMFLQTLKEGFIAPVIENAEGVGDITGAMAASSIHPDLELSDILTREERDAISGDIIGTTAELTGPVLAPALLGRALSAVPANSVLNKPIGSFLKEMYKGSDDVVRAASPPTHMEKLKAKYGDGPVVSADEIDRLKYEDANRLANIKAKHPRGEGKVIDASDRFIKKLEGDLPKDGPTWEGYLQIANNEQKRISAALAKYPKGSQGHKEALQVQRQLNKKLQLELPKHSQAQIDKDMEGIIRGIHKEGLTGDKLMKRINQLPEHVRKDALKYIQGVIDRL